MGPVRMGWIFLVLLPLCMVAVAEVDPKHPQLCYTSKDKLAPNSLMPCLKDLKDNPSEVYGCCLYGDHCLDHQSCWNKDTGITYQKGCTQKEYNDPNCPQKCGTDQDKSDWVGLVFCNGTHAMPKETWICHHPDNCKGCSRQWDTQLQREGDTYCEDIKHDGPWVAFKEKGHLDSIMSLPASTAMASWWSVRSNYSTRWVHTSTAEAPSLSASFTTTESTSLATTNASTSGQTLPTSSANDTTNLPYSAPTGTSSSGGQKIGLAVGLGAGIPLLLAGIGLLVFYMRRRRNQEVAGEQSARSDFKAGDGAPCHSPGETYGYSPKAELPANERHATMSEMDGSSVGGISPMQSPTVSPPLWQPSIRDDKREHQTAGTGGPPVYELAG